MREPRFTIDPKRSCADVASRSSRYRYVIGCDSRAVIENRSNGQSFHLTYVTEHGAREALVRVQILLPDAYVYDAVATGRVT